LCPFACAKELLCLHAHAPQHLPLSPCTVMPQLKSGCLCPFACVKKLVLLQTSFFVILNIFVFFIFCVYVVDHSVVVIIFLVQHLKVCCVRFLMVMLEVFAKMVEL